MLASMRLIPAIAFLLSTPALAANCAGSVTSPDKGATAKVTLLNESHEGLIEFFGADGKLLRKEAYSSPDMEHGSVIDQCAWTPDSKFFVFSTYSSGGHQSWSFPTLFYDRVSNKVLNLDDLIGPITDPDFTVAPPAILHSYGRMIPGAAVHVIKQVEANQPDVEFTVDLNLLSKSTNPSKPN